MSKKNKNKVAAITPEASAPVAPVVVPAPAGLTQDEETKLTELQAQIEALKTAKAERERIAKEKLITDLNALPAQFGMADMDAMIELLRKLKRGTLNGSPKVRSKGNRGQKIPDDVKANVDADLKADKDTVKVIAERYGVSGPWVQGRKKILGLVVARAA